MRTLLTILIISAVGSAVHAQGIRTGTRTPNGGVSMGRRDTSADERAKSIVRCKVAMKNANALIEKKKYYDAMQEVTRARVLAVTEELRDDLLEIIKDLNKVGKEKIKLVDKQVKQGNFLTAAKNYKMISRVFGEIHAGAIARRRYKDLVADPQYQDHLKESKAKVYTDRIEKLIAPIRKRNQKKANPSESEIKVDLIKSPLPERVLLIKQLAPKFQVTAIKYLELVIQKYPETKAANIAANDLSILQQDKDFMANLDIYKKNAQADNLLGKAEMYFNSGMEKKSLPIYREVLKKYPETKAAIKAAQRLKQAGKK